MRRQWQSTLPPFSQRVFSSAPHLAICPEEPPLPPPPRSTKLTHIAAACGARLPSWLVLSLSPHRDELLELLQQWLLSGLSFVPLSTFTGAIERTCRLRLQEREQIALVCSLDPTRTAPLRDDARALPHERLDLSLLVQLLCFPDEEGAGSTAGGAGGDGLPELPRWRSPQKRPQKLAALEY